MATVEPLSETIVSLETGELLRREIRPFTVRYRGRERVVDLPGYYPIGEGESVHVGEDMAAVDAALAALKVEAGTPTPEAIRAWRCKLRLSQRAADDLIAAGPKAFDKYERGLISPSGPALRLMTLLEKRPELVDELRAEVGAP